MKNVKLKNAFNEAGILQYEAAEKMRVTHTVISKFIHGIQEPTEEQKIQLATLLGKSKEELFG